MKSAVIVNILAWLSFATALEKKIESPSLIASGCLTWVDSEYSWESCKGLKKRKLVTCACKNTEILKSTVRCINELAANSTVQGAKKAAYKALAKSCSKSNITVSDISALSDEADALTVEVPKSRKNISKAFALPDLHYFWAYVAAYNRNVSEPRSYVYAGGVLGYWAGIILLRMIYHWFNTLLPRVAMKFNTPLNKFYRKNISLPALFGFSHCNTPVFFRYFTFNIPTRANSLIIAGYFIVNWALTFCYLPLYNAPNPNYSDNYWWQVGKAIGTRSGWVGTFQFPLLYVFGGRNNVLLFLTGWPLDTFNVFHKWVGRVVFLDIVTHAAGYTVVRIEGNRFTTMWSTPYWNWGVAALVMGALAVGIGIHWFRRLHYETFLILHIIGAVFFLVAGYYHLEVIDFDVSALYATMAVWAFDRAARLVRILLSNPLSRVRIRAVDHNTLEYTISYSGLWKAFPGSYAFVHLVQPTFFWESHPFSLMESVEPDEEGKLKLYVRTKDGATRRAMNKCVENGGQYEGYILIDGPYGIRYSFDNYDKAVFVAGGVGITAVYSCIQSIIKKDLPCQVTLHWGIMTESPLEWFASEFEYMLKSQKVKVILYIGNNPVGEESESSSNIEKGVEKASVSSEGIERGMTRYYHMMDTSSLIRQEIVNSEGSMAIMACGPGGINDAARQSVAQSLDLTKNYIEYYEEAFSW